MIARTAKKKISFFLDSPFPVQLPLCLQLPARYIQVLVLFLSLTNQNLGLDLLGERADTTTLPLKGGY